MTDSFDPSRRMPDDERPTTLEPHPSFPSGPAAHEGAPGHDLRFGEGPPYGGFEQYPAPPTAPPASQPGRQPADPHGGPEWVVNSGQPFAHAPDPFGASGGATAVPDPETKSGKGWIIPVALLVALAIIAAGAYFLFFDGKKDDTKKADSSSSQEAGRSGDESASPEGSAGQGTSLAGSYEVNGTIDSYTGQQAAQLGGSPKKAGDPAFKTPQTWTIEGECADSSCEAPLKIVPGDLTVALKLDGEMWKGETQETIQCSAAGESVQATIAIEIAKDGSTAKRTLTAPCAEAITEVDSLTLTKK